MTDRTFRSPSPHRPSSSGGPGHGYSQSLSAQEAPPVPSLPRDVATSQHRKANSLGMTSTPFRVASQKLKDGQGSWFGAAAVGDVSSVRTSDSVMKTSEKEPQGDFRPSSRGSSINFSYPARLRVASPPASPRAKDAEVEKGWPSTAGRLPDPPRQSSPPSQQNHPSQAKRLSANVSPPGSTKQRPSSSGSERELVWDPNSRRMIPRVGQPAVERRAQQVSEPSRPRQKKQTRSKAGSHLSQGTMGRTTGTAVREADDGHTARIPAAAEHPGLISTGPEPAHDLEYEEPAVKAIFPPRNEEPRGVRAVPTLDPFSPSSNLPEVDISGDEPLDLRPSLGKRPSTVMEEPEFESNGFRGRDDRRMAFEVFDAFPVRETVYGRPSEQPRAEERQIQQIPIHAPAPIAPTSPIELPTEAASRPGEAPTQAQKVVAIEPSEIRAVKTERTHSNSPARSAHFGTVHESLSVRHSPPPRAASPRKSALKQTSPSRGASPFDDNEPNALGDTATRKKSVRIVSFDDANTRVVGEAAPPEEPDTSSASTQVAPTARRPWYNLGLGKKKDLAPLEEEEIMKPRPALPSFGSVRDKKQHKEHDERPLVRPLDSSHSPSLPDSPGTQTSTAAVEEATPEALGPSPDHAIGSILSQDYASRHPANISRFREPLPPVVTSIEGHEYVSDTSSAESDDELVADTPVLFEEESQATTIPDVDTSVVSVPESTSSAEKAPAPPESKSCSPATVPFEADPTVPSISITRPSQERLSRPASKRTAFLDVPGTFPEDESDSSTRSQETGQTVAPKSVEMAQSHVPVTRQAPFEPVVQTEDSSHTPHTPGTVLATHVPVVAEEADDSGSSIYSDAYEDLSDVEGDGFLSIDAVVESPIATSVSKSPFGSSNSTPQQLKPEAPRVPKAPLGSQAQPLPIKRGDDWETAKAYWRTLTAEKRAQLEREAVEDAAADADLEANGPPKKPRRKKSVEKRQAEKKAIQGNHNPANPERRYMIEPGTKAEGEIVRTTMRMRTSMRGDGAPTSVTQHQRERPPETALRTSLRAAGPPEPSVQARPRATLSKAARPMSFPAPGGEGPRLHSRTLSDSVSPQKPQGKTGLFTSLRRKDSDSSESSFRRSRPHTSGGFGFRRTLREPSPPFPAGFHKERGGRKSLRSLSPPASPFRRVSAGYAPPRIPMTLRSSPDPKPRKTSGIHLPSFGRSSGSKSANKSKSKYASRFGDSSDEDNGPSHFRSRFDDSSDEDFVGSQRPLSLSTPKKERPYRLAARSPPPVPEEAPAARTPSPDLPDSSDEEPADAAAGRAVPPAVEEARVRASGRVAPLEIPKSNTDNAIGTSAIRRSRSGRGGIDSTLPLSPSSPTMGGGGKRGSLLSVLRRRKGGDAGGGVRRGELMDSAARRDTQLERSARELEAVRAATPTAGASAGTGTGLRLQKRGPAGWPLPMPVNDDEDDDSPIGEGSAGGEKKADAEPAPMKGQLKRPATSGNIGISTPEAATTRPGVLQRRSLSHGNAVFDAAISSGPTTVVTGGEKKKKRKFATIRRMLRLND